jgi:hypothetical protein
MNCASLLARHNFDFSAQDRATVVRDADRYLRHHSGAIRMANQDRHPDETRLLQLNVWKLRVLEAVRDSCEGCRVVWEQLPHPHKCGSPDLPVFLPLSAHEARREAIRDLEKLGLFRRFFDTEGVELFAWNPPIAKLDYHLNRLALSILRDLVSLNLIRHDQAEGARRDNVHPEKRA